MDKKLVKFSAKQIAYTAVLTALVYVGTMIGIGSGQFYFNLGDSAILIGAALLNPISAMLAGGLGAFFGDLTVFPATMLFTLAIKAAEGLVAGILFKAIFRIFAKKQTKLLSDFGAYSPEHTADEMGKRDLFTEAESEHDDIASADNDSATSQQMANEFKHKKRRLNIIKLCLATLATYFSAMLIVPGYYPVYVLLYGKEAAALLPAWDALQATISATLATLALFVFRLERLRMPLSKKN